MQTLKSLEGQIDASVVDRFTTLMLIFRNRIFRYVLTNDHKEHKTLQPDRQKIGKYFVSDILFQTNSFYTSSIARTDRPASKFGE